jgi:hypothetical protein
MFKWISPLILMFSLNCYAVPWYTIYRDLEKLNDSQIWQQNIDQLIQQYQSNIGDSSYQSEAGAIAQSLGKIENPRVVEIIWDYYKSASEYKNTALIACFNVARKNTLMQENLMAEFLASSSLELRFRSAIQMLYWETVPEIAVLFLFNSLNESSDEQRDEFLSNLLSILIRRDAPIQHLRLIQDKVFEQLAETKSGDEVRALSEIIAQLERRNGDAYLNLRSLYSRGQISKANFIIILKTISYEVNATVGATFRDLTPASINSFFNVLITAKNDSSAEVRATAVEASLWQIYKKEFPHVIREWIRSEIKSDAFVHGRAISVYKAFHQDAQAHLFQNFPGVFPKPVARTGFRGMINQCAEALTRVRDKLPF